MTDANAAEVIRDKGWGQCSVLDLDEHVFTFDTKSHLNRIARAALARWRDAARAKVRLSKGTAIDGAAEPDPPAFLPADYRTTGGKHLSVIVSQTCDVVATDTEEPWAEVMRVYRAPEPLVRAGMGNSARVFTVDAARGLLVDARHRSRIDKGALLTREPVGTLPDEPQLRERFVRWLGRRFTRPALPDALDAELRRKFESLLREEEGGPLAAAYHGCAEVRHAVVQEEPPYIVSLIFLTETIDARRELERHLRKLAAHLRDRLDPSVVRLTEPAVRCYTEISAGDYLAAKPFFLEHLTYVAGQVVGQEPPLPGS